MNTRTRTHGSGNNRALPSLFCLKLLFHVCPFCIAAFGPVSIPQGMLFYSLPLGLGGGHIKWAYKVLWALKAFTNTIDFSWLSWYVDYAITTSAGLCVQTYNSMVICPSCSFLVLSPVWKIQSEQIRIIFHKNHNYLISKFIPANPSINKFRLPTFKSNKNGYIPVGHLAAVNLLFDIASVLELCKSCVTLCTRRIAGLLQLVRWQRWHSSGRESARQQVIECRELIGSRLLAPPGPSIAEPHLQGGN